MFRLVLMILVLAANLLVLGVNGQECNNNGLKKVDDRVAKLTIMGTSRKFPESKGPEYKSFCDLNKVYIKDIENYKTKCMKDLPKQLTAVLTHSMKSGLGQFCNKNSKNLDKLLAGTKCYNKGTFEMGKCYTSLLDSFLGTFQADDKKKIPHICCEYYALFPCIEKRLSTVSICTEDYIKNANEFIKSITGSSIEILCGDYVEGSDKCENLGPPPKKRKDQRRPKSYLMPLVNLLDSLPKA